MNEFIIYGRPGCGFCVRAKQICEAKSLKYQYIDIWAKEISKEELAGKAGKVIYTVPQIFLDEKHIGGCDDFEAYLSSLGQ